MLRRDAHFVFLLASSTGACAQIIDADGYRVAPPGSDDTPLPALPDQAYIDGCRHCAKTQCGAELQTCQENPRCQDMLACSGVCSDPACLAHCADTLPESPDFDIYFNCLFLGAGLYDANARRKCAVDCNAGKNLECADKYQWGPIGFVQANLSLRDVISQVQDDPLASIVGGTVTPCGDLTATATGGGAQGCSSRTFAVEPDGDVSNIPFASVDDAFVLRGAAGEQQRLYPRRVTGPGRLTFGISPRRAFLDWLLLWGATFDPSKAIVVVEQEDCLGSNSLAGNEVALDVSPANTPLYTSDRGVYSKTNLPAPQGVFLDVDAAPGRVTVTRTNGGALVQRRTVLVAPGWITEVALTPYARDD